MEANTVSLLHLNNNVTDEVAGGSWQLVGSNILHTSSGKFGGGVQITGTASYLESTSLSYTNAAAFTAEIWVKRLAVTGADEYLFGKSSPGSGEGWDVRIGSNGSVKAVGMNGWAVNITSSAGLVPLDTWTHVALSCQASGGMAYLFVNGTLAGSCARSNINFNSSTFKIGFQTDYSSSHVTGIVDEFRFSDVTRWTSDFSVPSEPYGAAVFNVVVNASGKIIVNTAGKLIKSLA